MCLVGRGGFGFVLPSAGQVAWGAGPPRTVAHSACPSQWVLAFEIFIPLVLFFILLGLRQKKPTISVKEGEGPGGRGGARAQPGGRGGQALTAAHAHVLVQSECPFPGAGPGHACWPGRRTWLATRLRGDRGARFSLFSSVLFCPSPARSLSSSRACMQSVSARPPPPGWPGRQPREPCGASWCGLSPPPPARLH